MTRPARSLASRWDPVAACVLAAVLGVLWLALSGGEDWLFGGLAVLAAVLLSQMLAPLPRIRLSLPGLLRFLAFFAHGSLAGGVDVARRALSPGPQLDVVRHEYRLGLPPGPPRAVFAGVVTLLPGTLSVRLEESTLLVHSIAGDPRATLAGLECRVAALFGLDEGSGGGPAR